MPIRHSLWNECRCDLTVNRLQLITIMGMKDLEKQYQNLQKLYSALNAQFNLDEKQLQLKSLDEQMSEDNFWQDSAKAGDVSRRHGQLKQSIDEWLGLRGGLSEVGEFLDLAGDDLEDEISRRLEVLGQEIEVINKNMRFSGEHDGNSAILTIQPGAGGVDAQDWAEMLLRMYCRWATGRKDMKYRELETSFGEEAGIKSASIRIEGVNAYGWLKSESGVHRLVRLSPFNSGNTRETSFAMVEVVPDIDSPEFEDLDMSDIRVDVYRSGGKGGQSVNTTDSAVRVTHLPTGVVVAIQNERSQQQNKETALKILRSKLWKITQDLHAKKIADLSGPHLQAAWGSQIRNYVLHPYTLVKDTRSAHQESNIQAVLDGSLDGFMDAYLDMQSA